MITLHCHECGADFQRPEGAPGRLPMTCGPECAHRRRIAQTRESERRNRARMRQEAARKKESDFQRLINRKVEERVAEILGRAMNDSGLVAA